MWHIEAKQLRATHSLRELQAKMSQLQIAFAWHMKAMAHYQKLCHNLNASITFAKPRNYMPETHKHTQTQIVQNIINEHL